MKRLKVFYEDWAWEMVKAHNSDAGFDLRTPYVFTIAPMSYWVVNTGIHIEIPKGYAGLIVSKSGLNVKHGIQSTGLIDSGYAGCIVVKLYNFSMDEYHFKAGDKITQLMILPIFTGKIKKIKTLNVDTERGTNGFGSSGK